MNLKHNASVTTRGHIQMHLSICKQLDTWHNFTLPPNRFLWRLKYKTACGINHCILTKHAHQRQLNPQFLNIHKCVQNSDDIKEFGVVNWQYKK